MKRVLARLFLQGAGLSSSTVTTSVGQIHVLLRPGRQDATPLVLLHGFSSSGFAYLPLLLHLRAWPGPILALDFPAHGMSDVPTPMMTIAALRAGFLEAMAQCVTRPALIFGNSLGGAVAVAWALSHPGHVRGLILCSPGGAAMTPDELQAFRTLFRVNSLADAHAFLRRALAQRPALLPVMAVELWRRLHRGTYRTLLDSLTTDDLLDAAQVNALQVPVLLVWGRQDRLLPSSHLAFFRRHLPVSARIIEPEQFGHVPYLEDPRQVSETILAFAADLQNRQT